MVVVMQRGPLYWGALGRNTPIGRHLVPFAVSLWLGLGVEQSGSMSVIETQ